VLEPLVTSGPRQHGWNLGVEIRGQTEPFQLYFVVGDPESGPEPDLKWPGRVSHSLGREAALTAKIWFWVG
jgi:hypothetical protein